MAKSFLKKSTGINANNKPKNPETVLAKKRRQEANRIERANANREAAQFSKSKSAKGK